MIWGRTKSFGQHQRRLEIQDRLSISDPIVSSGALLDIGDSRVMGSRAVRGRSIGAQNDTGLEQLYYNTLHPGQKTESMITLHFFTASRLLVVER